MIDWKKAFDANPWAKWGAIDRSGHAHLFRDKPKVSEVPFIWMLENGAASNEALSDLFVYWGALRTRCPNWRKSLVRRSDFIKPAKKTAKLAEAAGVSASDHARMQHIKKRINAAVRNMSLRQLQTYARTGLWSIVSEQEDAAENDRLLNRLCAQSPQPLTDTI